MESQTKKQALGSSKGVSGPFGRCVMLKLVSDRNKNQPPCLPCKANGFYLRLLLAGLVEISLLQAVLRALRPHLLLNQAIRLRNLRHVHHWWSILVVTLTSLPLLHHRIHGRIGSSCRAFFFTFSSLFLHFFRTHPTQPFRVSYDHVHPRLCSHRESIGQGRVGEEGKGENRIGQDKTRQDKTGQDRVRVSRRCERWGLTSIQNRTKFQVTDTSSSTINTMFDSLRVTGKKQRLKYIHISCSPRSPAAFAATFVATVYKCTQNRFKLQTHIILCN